MSHKTCPAERSHKEAKIKRIQSGSASRNKIYLGSNYGEFNCSEIFIAEYLDAE
jgi:hypothetical protein